MYMSYTVMFIAIAIALISAIKNMDMIVAWIIQIVWGIAQVIFFIPFVIAFDMLMLTIWTLISMVNGGYSEFESLTAATLRDLFNI